MSNSQVVSDRTAAYDAASPEGQSAAMTELTEARDDQSFPRYKTKAELLADIARVAHGAPPLRCIAICRRLSRSLPVLWPDPDAEGDG